MQTGDLEPDAALRRILAILQHSENRGKRIAFWGQAFATAPVIGQAHGDKGFVDVVWILIMKSQKSLTWDPFFD